jgi:hypothetical protein
MLILRNKKCCIIIIIIINVVNVFPLDVLWQLMSLLLLLLLFTAIGFSPGGSSPYTSTHNTNVFTRWQ